MLSLDTNGFMIAMMAIKSCFYYDSNLLIILMMMSLFECRPSTLTTAGTSRPSHRSVDRAGIYQLPCELFVLTSINGHMNYLLSHRLEVALRASLESLCSLQSTTSRSCLTLLLYC